MQKYRLYLSRLQKDGDQNSSGGIQHSDFPLKDPEGSVSLQNLVNQQQNDASIDSCSYSNRQLQIQNVDAQGHEDGNIKKIASESTINKKADLTGNIHDTEIRSSQKSHDQSFAPPDSERNHAAPSPTQYSWGEFPEVQFKEHASLLPLNGSFNQLPLPSTQHHLQFDQSQANDSISSNPSVIERETAACNETRPLYADCTSNYSSSMSSICSAETFSMQSKSFTVNELSLEPIKSQGPNLGCISDQDLYSKNLCMGSELASAPLDENAKSFWPLGEGYNNMNFGVQNIEFPEYYYPRLIGEVPTYLYDTSDCSVDQGLFIA